MGLVIAMLTWTENKYEGGRELVAKCPDRKTGRLTVAYALITHSTGYRNWFVHWWGLGKRVKCQTRKAAVAMVEERYARDRRAA